MPHRPPPSFAQLALPLLLGAALLLFAMGRDTVPLASWVALIFLVRYSRRTPHGYGLGLTAAALAGAFLFQMRGMVPMPPPEVIALAVGAGLAGTIPFALDRFVARRSPAFWTTLAFPCAFVALQWLNGRTSPFGSWGAWAYSQYGNLELMQLASLTGLSGITFVVCWLGPVTNWAWEHDFAWPRVRRGLAAFAAVLAAIYAFGAARLLLSPTGAPFYRAAGITADDDDLFPNDDTIRRFWGQAPLSPAEWTAIRAGFARHNARLFARTRQEAAAGARLVFWSEGAARTLRSDESSLIQQGSEAARQSHCYLGLAIWSVDRTRPKPVENKLVLLGPDGRVRYEYWKSRPVPGPEAQHMETNGNALRCADTPLGRVAACICFDLDFPSLVRQAGVQHADLLLGPSNDWAAIDPWNTQQAAFRAVECGCTLFRNVSHGRSLVVDPYGRPLAESDYFTSEDRVLTAEIPARGTRTLYALWGDWFAGCCAAGLTVTIVAVWRRSGPSESP